MAVPPFAVDVKNAFGLVLRLAEDTRENVYTFVSLCDQPTAKLDFLWTLCRHMAKVYNVPDYVSGSGALSGVGRTLRSFSGV